MQQLNNDEKEILRMTMERLTEDCLIDPAEELSYPLSALSCGHTTMKTKEGTITYPIPIGTYGNFSFIQAPPKTKKTFLVSLLVATYLNNTIEGYTGQLEGHRNNNQHVVHFDTEQGNWHAQRVFRRPLMMPKQNPDNYHTLALRQLSFIDRINFIEYYLYDKLEGKNIGLVVIDGIADLCSDVNDITQGNYVAQKLMQWTKELNCHIITVIHSNYGSTKATGHLGSTLYKKCETAINLEVNTVHTDQITVSCVMSRNTPFESFDFLVNDYGLPKVQGAVYDILKGLKY
jgi:hypothetical protein